MRLVGSHQELSRTFWLSQQFTRHSEDADGEKYACTQWSVCVCSREDVCIIKFISDDIIKPA